MESILGTIGESRNERDGEEEEEEMKLSKEVTMERPVFISSTPGAFPGPYRPQPEPYTSSQTGNGLARWKHRLSQLF